MHLIAGLGNPGARYQATRHNIGFVVLERLATAHSLEWREQFDGLTTELRVGAARALLLKPLTFMNRSGFSVGKVAGFFKIPPDQVLVVHDEVDLPLGTLRLKQGGGEAGHNGLKSVTAQLGTADYLRLRCGVGRPPPEFPGDTADYVLQAFAPAEGQQVEAMVDGALQALRMVLEAGLQQAMNHTNRRPKT
jgi:PTH1 family peptidyl-tRNA hydrolase